MFSLQDETDLGNQGIDAAVIASDCQAAGVKHVRFPTSDAGKSRSALMLKLTRGVLLGPGVCKERCTQGMWVDTWM